MRSLDEHDVIGFVPPLTHTPGGVWLARNAAGANVVLRVDNVGTALECAADGLGVAASPEYMAVRDPRLTRVLVGEDVGESEVFLVTRRDRARVPRVRVTLDALAESLRTTSTARRRA